MYYYRSAGETPWQAVRQIDPFVFPDFKFSREALSARLGNVEEMNGRQAQAVTYSVYMARTPVTFTRWVDLENKLIVQEYMDAPGHHMLSVYHEFNKPVLITRPASSEISPSPTVTTP
jgi:hypothetical protein